MVKEKINWIPFSLPSDQINDGLYKIWLKDKSYGFVLKYFNFFENIYIYGCQSHVKFSHQVCRIIILLIF